MEKSGRAGNMVDCADVVDQDSQSREEMIDIDSVINDIRHAVEATLEGRVYEDINVVEDVVAKVRALVVPVFNDQIAKIMEYEERIAETEELEERVDELKEEVLDREDEDERQTIINIFNSCDRKVVGS